MVGVDSDASKPVGSGVGRNRGNAGTLLFRFLRFRGGKAVACFVGAFAYIAPLPVAITIAIFVLAVWISKYISVGSIVGALAFPLVLWLRCKPPVPILVASIAAALLVIYRHKANIERLRSGTENVFSLKGRKSR